MRGATFRRDKCCFPFFLSWKIHTCEQCERVTGTANIVGVAATLTLQSMFRSMLSGTTHKPFFCAAHTCSLFILSKICESKAEQRIKGGIQLWDIGAVQTTKNTKRKIHIRLKELWRVGNLLLAEKYRNDEVPTLLLCVYCLMYMFSHFIEQISDYSEMASQEVRQRFGAFFCVPNHSVGLLDARSALKITIIIQRPFTRF